MQNNDHERREVSRLEFKVVNTMLELLQSKFDLVTSQNQHRLGLLRTQHHAARYPAGQDINANSPNSESLSRTDTNPIPRNGLFGINSSTNTGSGLFGNHTNSSGGFKFRPTKDASGGLFADNVNNIRERNLSGNTNHISGNLFGNNRNTSTTPIAASSGGLFSGSFGCYTNNEGVFDVGPVITSNAQDKPTTPAAAHSTALAVNPRAALNTLLHLSSLRQQRTRIHLAP